jgi:BirA family biotin operon repressor/biotin-[acetyl-CoA-carboxylase] ligase
MSTIRWPAESIWEAVVPMLAGFTVEVVAHIDSTNTELMRRARAGQTDAVLLVAERQSAGRGRLGRHWEGEPGAALTFSIGMCLEPVDWSGLSLAVGLAVVQSLHPELQLKWPNDVWFQERKLAGILIETATVGDVRYAVVGIGINIAAPSAQGLRTEPAGLQELLPVMDAPSALAKVAPAVVAAVLEFQSQGFAPLRSAFHVRDALYARELVCSDGQCGIGRGVDASGALLLQGEGGVHKISSAEVSVRPAQTPRQAGA